MNKLNQLVIELNTKESVCEEIPGDWRSWGGRAFTSRWILEHVPASCDALGEQNDLVFATGLFAGSGASSSGRLSTGAKSPLTNGIKESNTGGNAGNALTSLGLRAIILQGISAEWVVIVIGQNGVRFVSAADCVGMETFECTRQLLSRFGSDCAALSIGPAGEYQMKAACIGSTDKDGVPARHAGRGGLGAVMGAKKVKAVVIEPGSLWISEWRDPEALKKSVKRFSRALLDHPTTGQFLPKFGTAMILDVTQKIGGLPTKNFSQGQFDGADQVNGEALYNLIVERKGSPTHACMPGCVIRCSNVIPGKNGSELNRALEYETLALLGPNCGIDDLDTICALNRKCDALGLDTIDIGGAIGVAMDNGLLEFGDGQKALALLDEVSQATPTGKMIGDGAAATGAKLGARRIPAVLGQSLAAYDPRVLKGTGVTYATSPMGADHTAGNVLPGMKLPDGSQPPFNLAERQIELSRYTQLMATMFDYLGLCWFAKPPVFEDLTLITDILNAQFEDQWDFDRILSHSAEVIEMEWQFNEKAGLKREYDLPSFFREDPLLPGNSVFDVDRKDLSEIDKIKFN